MKYNFFFLCLLITYIVSKCDQYATKETCIDNCWCAWRSGLWQHPDACISFSSADECDYEHGVICVDNESRICYFADAFILLIEVMLFLSTLGCGLILILGVICIILFLIGDLFHTIQKELEQRELKHWITYINIVAITLIVILILFVVLTGTFHMIKMLYESTF